MFIWQIIEERKGLDSFFRFEFSQVVIELQYCVFLLYLDIFDFLVVLIGFKKIDKEYKVYKLLKCLYERWEYDDF